MIVYFLDQQLTDIPMVIFGTEEKNQFRGIELAYLLIPVLFKYVTLDIYIE